MKSGWAQWGGLLGTGLSHRWPSWQHDSSLLEKKTTQLFSEQLRETRNETDSSLGSGRAPATRRGQHVLAMRAIERPVGASRGIAGDYSRAQGRSGTRTVQFKSTYF